MQWLGRALGLGEAPSQGTPRSRCAPSAGQGRFSGHTSLPASPPRLEGTARPLVRKRQPAKSVAAAAQYASAGAPGRGRSQFRRESRARRNPREAGPEPGGRACLPEGVDLGWRVCSSANSHLTDDGGRLEPRLCPSQTFRQKSELYPGHEDSREAGSRDNGVWGAGEGSMAGPTQTPRRLRRPRLRRPSRQLPQHLWGGEDLGVWAGPWLQGWLRPRALLLGRRGRPLMPPAYWHARANAAPHWSVPIWAPNSKILKVPAGAF